MHPCLGVEDIVELIAHFTEEDLDIAQTGAKPAASVALARTCRAFYEPASNVVWSQLSSILPLTKLFKLDPCVFTIQSPISLQVRFRSFDPRPTRY